jgi:peptidoglycan biosynthesis protein MviN/MurJ (putative lipid II flippase)
MVVSIGVAVAAAVLLTKNSHVIVQLLYAGGSFGTDAVESTAQMCALLAWALPPTIVLWVVLMPALNGRRPLLPATIYISGYLLQITATAFLFPIYGKNGLIFAYLAGVYVQAILSTAVVVRECFPFYLSSVTRERIGHEPTC